MNDLQFGLFTLDRRQRELRKQDSVLPVSGKAFDLLSYMASNAGRPLSKAELLGAVWPTTSVDESNLSQNVFLLRKVLGSGDNGPIKTLPGRGYQFAAEVTEIDSPAPLSSPRRPEAPAPSAPVVTLEATHTRMVIQHDIEERISWSLPWSKSIAAWTFGIGIVLVGFAGWFGWQRWLDRTGGSPVQVVLTEFEGGTGDSALDRALLSALRMDLSQSPFVSVVSGEVMRATLVEMKLNPDDRVNASTALELCERTNSEVVLRGTIAHSGDHYLLTEEATSCVNRKTLAAALQEADKPEDLPRAADRLARGIRQQLGESRRSIAHFRAPLFPADTASLDALKDYSAAERAGERGDMPGAIHLLQQAVTADPQFALAYAELAAVYLHMGDARGQREAILKGYSLRDSAGPLSRLFITSVYSMTIPADLYRAERDYKEWARLYPKSAIAWNAMSVVQGQLGKNSDAILSGAHALLLRPKYVALYTNLANFQMHAGEVEAARTTCQNALTLGLDGDPVRSTYLSVAYLRHDPLLIKAQRDWAGQHPDAPYFWLNEAKIAIAEGRFRDAQELIHRSTDQVRELGLNSLADTMTKQEGLDLILAGDREDGVRLFRAIPLDPESGNDLTALVELGDLAKADAALRAISAAKPNATLWNLYFGPRIRAGIALANHKPQDAVTLLAPTRTLDGRGFSIPRFRGAIYLAAGQPALAEKEFRAVIAHPELDPLSSDYALSWLGLGEALTAEGNRGAAADAYQHFLKLWAHADSDATYLKRAKQEFAAIQAAS